MAAYKESFPPSGVLKLLEQLHLIALEKTHGSKVSKPMPENLSPPSGACIQNSGEDAP